MSPANLLEFVARLTYNVDGLSGQLRLYFSQFLTFHFSKSLSVNQIQDIENKKASLKLSGSNEIKHAAGNLTEAELCWSVASILLLQAEANRIDDRVMSRRLGALADDLIVTLQLQNSSELIATEKLAIDEELRRFQERLVIRVPARIWPLWLDFLLRCAVLVYWNLNGLKFAWLVVTNTLFIPIFIMGIVVIYGRGNRKANMKRLETHGGAENYTFEYRVSAGQYTWLAIFLVISTFVSYLLPTQLHAAAFFGLAFYYFIYLRFFSIGRISENELVKQLDNKTQGTDSLGVDENDEVIVSLETKLNASTSRLEAYVLESALFGALTFSGFLQIMASDLVSFSDLENFATGIFTTSQALIQLQGEAFWSGLSQLNNKVSLFCLVSVESLVCSIFFLAVIASRLRFSDIADKVRTAIDLARTYNLKEEALYHESEKSDIRQSRLQEMTQRVNKQLFVANKALARVGPVMAYMQYFRNAGILVFLIILVSSSLFITSVLGWTFIGLVAATFVYFNREHINTNLKAAMLQLRIGFLKRSTWFVLLSLSPFFIAAILRNSFHWNSTPILMAVGYLLTGLYLFTWLLVASHYDEGFGEIEKGSKVARVTKWNVIKFVLAGVVLLYFVGMTFKQLYLAGADEMALIGLSLIALLMYPAGYYLNKVRWLGLVSGIFLGSAAMGILFRILHLSGGTEMLWIGMIGLVAIMLLILWKSKLFHSLFIRLCAAILFITVSLLGNLFLRLDLAYAHRTTDIEPLLNVIYSNGDFMETDTGDLEALSATEWYISQYGSSVPYSAIYQDLVRMYNFAGEYRLTSARSGTREDSVSLSTMQRFVAKRDQILELYKFPREMVAHLNMALESDLLLAQGRRVEAEAALQRMIRMLDYPEQQEVLKEKLATLRGSIVGGSDD